METAAHPHLPEPALTLSLPSIHDGTLLDCRVYLPSSIVAAGGRAPSSGTGSSSARPVWRGDAAVVAHPYAPLGGSYNDPIVRLVAYTLLTRGQFVVATFNFRGASSGKGAGGGGSGHGGVGGWSASHLSGKKDKRWGGGGGRTSWTAKPETADYMTVVGFLYYFVHVLDPYGHKAEATEAAGGLASGAKHVSSSEAAFLCAGYSYGAMVTSLLPPLDAILDHFARPRRGSPAAAVRWRAARWAAIQNADLKEMREAAAAAPAGPHGGSLRGEARLSMGVRVGGGEAPRRSHDAGARKSLDAVWRRSGEHHHHHRHHHHAASTTTTSGSHAQGHRHRHRITGLVARVVAGRTRNSSSSSSNSIGSNSSSDDGGAHGAHRKGDDEKDSHLLPAVPGLPAVRPAYLLVSPPVGLATRLATMSWGGGGGGGEAASPAARHDETAESKLAANPTLVVYGDADGFVSHRTMRQWTARLTGASLLRRRRNRSGSGAAASSPLGTLGTLGALGTQSQDQDGGPDRALFRALVVQTAGHFWVEGRTLYELEAAVGAFVGEIAQDGERQISAKLAAQPTTTERTPGARPVSAKG